MVCSGNICWDTAYPPLPTDGPKGLLISMLAFSIPWVMGHLLATWRVRLPVLPVTFGVACFVIGLAFTRCPLTNEYYDIFRLSVFSLCCCPLMLSLIQVGEPSLSAAVLFQIRTTLALLAVLLLWTISPSLPIVKAALSTASIIVALCPLAIIGEVLRLLGWLRPPLVYIGSISYGIYAIHSPIIALIVFLLPHEGSVIRVLIFSSVILFVAHFMERIVQPALSGPKPSRMLHT